MFIILSYKLYLACAVAIGYIGQGLLIDPTCCYQLLATLAANFRSLQIYFRRRIRWTLTQEYETELAAL